MKVSGKVVLMNTHMHIPSTRERLSSYGKMKQKIASFSFFLCFCPRVNATADANRRCGVGAFSREKIHLARFSFGPHPLLSCAAPPTHGRAVNVGGFFLESGTNVRSNGATSSADSEVTSDTQCYSSCSLLFLCGSLFDERISVRTRKS